MARSFRSPPAPFPLEGRSGTRNSANHSPRLTFRSSSSWTLVEIASAIGRHHLLVREATEQRPDLLPQALVLHVELLGHPTDDPVLHLPLVEELPHPGAGAVELEDLVGLHVDQHDAIARAFGHHVLARDPPLAASGRCPPLIRAHVGSPLNDSTCLYSDASAPPTTTTPPLSSQACPCNSPCSPRASPMRR